MSLINSIFLNTCSWNLWELNRLIGVLEACVEEDITVLPAWNCFSSNNCKIGCCKTCSPSHVVSSVGNYFHCTKYSRVTLFLSFFSRTYRIHFGIHTRSPSSSNGGNSMDGALCFPTIFLRFDTWNILWILISSRSSST